MTAFTIEVKDEEVRKLLSKLASRAGGLQPVLQVIGEGIIERTKRRFETSTGPDGVKWQANSAVTLAMLSKRLSGHKGKVKKDGSLNAAGQRAYANKKPLIDSGELRRQFTLAASASSVTVGNTLQYAAIHQFGGKAGRGHKVTIPARPFLPVRQDGTLYPDEQATVLAALNHFLMEGL
jgi:phage virion morphogenesis protein